MGKKKTIGNIAGGLMVLLALIVDGLQFFLTGLLILIPFSFFVTILSLTTFGVWFAVCGVNYFSGGGKKFLTVVATTITELAPLITAIPATTAGVLGIIIQTRIEDARANAGGKVTPRTAAAAVRLQRMNNSRATRASSARTEREGTQQARHAPANDNSPRAANDNTSASQGQEAA